MAIYQYTGINARQSWWVRKENGGERKGERKREARGKVADNGRNEAAKRFKATVTSLTWISPCFHCKHPTICAYFELGHQKNKNKKKDEEEERESERVCARKQVRERENSELRTLLHKD